MAPRLSSTAPTTPPAIASSTAFPPASSDLVSKRFGSSAVVSSPSSSSDFFLVASFGRSAVRINEDSVGLILQSCLGGVAKDFRVILLRDWCFRFSVSCKDVGFMIYRLRSVINQHFALFFALWGNGGPDSVRQKQIWDAIQDEEWHLVCRSKKSYAAVVKSPPPPPIHGDRDDLRSHIEAKKRFAGARNANKAIVSYSKRPASSVFQRLRYPNDYFKKNYAADFSGFQQKSRFGASVAGNFQKGCAVHRASDEPKLDRACSSASVPCSSGDIQISNQAHIPPWKSSGQILCFRCLSPDHRVINCNNEASPPPPNNAAHVRGPAPMDDDRSPAARYGGRDSAFSAFSGAAADFAASGGVRDDNVDAVQARPVVARALFNPNAPPESSRARTALIGPLPPPPALTIGQSAAMTKNVAMQLVKVAVDQGTEEPGKMLMPHPEDLASRALHLLPPPTAQAEEENQDEEADVMEIEASAFKKTPNKKRRAKKLRAPISTFYLRRSNRLRQAEGYHHNAAPEGMVDDAALVEVPVGEAPVAMEHAPMEMQLYVPAPADQNIEAPAPHLSIENIQAIGTGFVQLQPSAVTAAALNAAFSDDDKE
ncbi:hypothetical protein EJB05_00680, partial [Eragrostis curvula]